MDQIKIGRFISELRKEKNMTQLELATKLGVTDRAVSKWENGRGLPDLSLIKPLCEILSISINELLSAERIEKENMTEKAEENIINTLRYSNKNIKKTKTTFFVIFAVFISIFVLLTICFGIDVKRMRNNLPVVFSTWGFKYAPEVNLQDEKIELAIKEYITTKGDGEYKHHQVEKTFAAIRTYLIEETKPQTRFNVYVWVLQQKYYMQDDEIKEDSGYSIPYKFEIEKQNEKYVVVDSHYPRDSSYYEDMKNLFPRSVRKDMDNIYIDGTYERLKMQIDEQVRLYFLR